MGSAFFGLGTRTHGLRCFRAWVFEVAGPGPVVYVGCGEWFCGLADLGFRGLLGGS